MASYNGNFHLELAKMEQIITEFFAKSLHIILESRCPYVSSRNYSGELFLSSPSPSSSSSSSSSCPPRDKWFNLALRDCPAALQNIDFWRQSNLEPMIVDIVLVESPNHHLLEKEQNCGSELKSEKTIERWVIQYESIGNGGCSSGNSKRLGSTSSLILYKKSILLLRSLYAAVRLLPAYKLFRDLISSARIRLYNLSHRVSSFVEPFTSREDTDMQQLEFTPVETSCGRLCLSVLYNTSMVDVSSEPSIPISLQFIPEYVGSPLAEPLKRFPSGPGSRSSRRHSWSYDSNRALPSSPAYPDFHAMISKQHHLPPLPVAALPRQSQDKKALVRCETAPSSIIPPLSNHQLVIPSPPTAIAVSEQDAGFHHKKTILPVDKLCGKDEPGEMAGLKPSLSCPPQRSLSGSSSRLSFQDDRGDPDFSEAFFVGDDDRVIPGSRQSSLNLSGKPTHSHELGSMHRIKKSQDTAVSALVHILKKAPPLQKNSATLPQNSQGSADLEPFKNHPTKEANNNSVEETTSSNGKSSAIVTSKTLGDALEELRAYSEMKDKLLEQGKTPSA